MHNIKMIQFSQLCCQDISLQYSSCQLQNNYSDYIHSVTINQIVINGFKLSKVSLHIDFDFSMYYLKIFLQNSYFYNVNHTALQVRGRYYLTTKEILVKNCTFKFINGYVAISIKVLPFNRNITFIN